LAAFDKMIADLQSSPNRMSNRLTAQIAFIINLILFACCKEHPMAEGKTVRLMAFAPEQNVDRDLTFAVRAGRLLQQIWVGGYDGPIIDRLLIDDRRSSMPDDVFCLIAISRWAIVRALAATSAVNEGKSLAPFLHAATVKIYRSTLRFGGSATDLDPLWRDGSAAGVRQQLGQTEPRDQNGSER
jgi:hypothetical protein